MPSPVDRRFSHLSCHPLRAYRRGRACASLAISLALVSPSALAAPRAKVGPASASGTRSVDKDAARARPEPKAKSKALTTHKIGRAPKAPKATLPDGAPRSEPDGTGRARVAGSTPRSELDRVSDPELSALQRAEKTLFPRPLSGLIPGWSWDLHADTSSPLPSGLPPSVDPVASATMAEATQEEWLQSLTMPDLPVRLDSRVVKYLKFYRDNKQGRAIAKVWAQKIGRYTPALKAEFAKAGLPTDLVWLSLIESGHNPTAVSPAGAAGLWQFIPESGRLYGLTVDRWVDERLDPLRATEAAIRYLSDLHQRFGSWELAMAAYNMGHGGMLRAVRKFNTNDYWRLSRFEAGLPWETTLYIPKIFAIAIVMNNKKAFGLDQINEDPPVSFDTIHVEGGTSLAQIASSAEVDDGALASLNPQYLSGRLPPDKKTRAGKDTQAWPIYLPEGRGAKALRSLSQKSSANHRFTPYVVRFGDTFETIAYRCHTTTEELERINQARYAEQLREGTVLLVPRLERGERLLSDKEDAVVVPPERFHYADRERVFYRTLSNDNVDQIARAFSVSSEELAAWNALDEHANLQSGMALQVYPPKAADLTRVRYVTANATSVLEAGTKQFYDHAEAANGRQRIVVLAKKGDTLSSIGKRYDLSASMMERINRFSRRKQLDEGERVVVYTKRKHPTDKTADEETAARTLELGPARAPHPDALPGSSTLGKTN